MRPSAEWLQGRNYLETRYGRNFTDTALTTVRSEMLKSNSIFKVMHDLRYASASFKSGKIGRIASKIKYFFWNILYPYHQYEKDEIDLAERMIRTGETVVFVTPPDSACMFPSNFYQAKWRSKG